MPTKSHTPPPHTHSNQPGRSTQPSQRERARTPSALSVALAPPAKILVTTRGTVLLLLDAAAMSVAFSPLGMDESIRLMMPVYVCGWFIVIIVEGVDSSIKHRPQASPPNARQPMHDPLLDRSTHAPSSAPLCMYVEAGGG